MASSGSRPALRPSRYLRHDEQGVVDTDADTDHGAERDREVGDRDHVRQQCDEARTDADTEQRDADGETHGQYRPERQDQDDDRETQADQFGLGWFEFAERLATDLHLETVDVGRRQIGDLGADFPGFGLAERFGQIDLGIGDLPGQFAFGGDESECFTLRRVGAGEGDTFDGTDFVEEFGHRSFDLGVIDTLIRAEDDRARAAASGPTEIGVERVESALGLRVGDRERAVARRADGANERKHGDQCSHPHAEDQPATSETEAAELAPRRVGNLDGDVRRAVSGLVRTVGIVGLIGRVPRGSGRHVHYWTV